MTILICKPNNYKELEVAREVQLEGVFTMNAYKNGQLVRSQEFKNLITNGGMNRLGSSAQSNQIRNFCQIGTGVVTPAITDSGLALYTAGVVQQGGATTGNVSVSPAYAWSRTRYLFAVGALNGNYTEIGAAWQSTTGGLFSRALIVNGVGVPTAFTVSIDEQLEVYYELRLYVNESDLVESSVPISSTNYTLTTRALAISSNTNWACPDGFGEFFSITPQAICYTGGLGLMTATDPGGTFLGAHSSRSKTVYGSGNYYHNVTNTWSPATVNGTVRTIKEQFGCCSFQTEYNPTFTKTSTQTLVLNSRIAWARYP